MIRNQSSPSRALPPSCFPTPSPCSLLTQLYTAALKLGAHIAGCSMQLAFTKALDQRRGQGQTLPLYEICPGNYAGRWNQYYVLYILIHTTLLPGVFSLFLLHATILPASHLSWVPEVCNEDSKVNAPTDHRKSLMHINMDCVKCTPMGVSKIRSP